MILIFDANARAWFKPYQIKIVIWPITGVSWRHLKFFKLYGFASYPSLLKTHSAGSIYGILLTTASQMKRIYRELSSNSGLRREPGIYFHDAAQARSLRDRCIHQMDIENEKARFHRLGTNS